MYKIIPILVLIILVGKSSQDKIKIFQDGITIRSEKCQEAQGKHGQDIMACVNNIFIETIKHMDSTGKNMTCNMELVCSGPKQAEKFTNVLKVYNFTLMRVV